jgi:hypothetical protein
MFNSAGAIVGETEGEGDSEVEGEVASPWLVSSPGVTLEEPVGLISSSFGVPAFG